MLNAFLKMLRSNQIKFTLIYILADSEDVQSSEYEYDIS